MADWQTALAADGPKVAEWIEENLTQVTSDATSARRLREWKKGARADFWAVDKLLTKFDAHVSRLPDGVWLGEREKAYASGRKPAPIDPKPCETCGNDIPVYFPNGKRRSPVRYAQARFCSPRCHYGSAQRGASTTWTPEMRNRAKELREVGLSFEAVASVVNLDYGVETTREAVRFLLRRQMGVPAAKAKNSALRRAA